MRSSGKVAGQAGVPNDLVRKQKLQHRMLVIATRDQDHFYGAHQENLNGKSQFEKGTDVKIKLHKPVTMTNPGRFVRIIFQSRLTVKTFKLNNYKLAFRLPVAIEG